VLIDFDRAISALPRDPHYGFAPTSVPLTTSGVVETAVGRKPRAIIQIASTSCCTSMGMNIKVCSVEATPMTAYIAEQVGGRLADVMDATSWMTGPTPPLNLALSNSLRGEVRGERPQSDPTGVTGYRAEPTHSFAAIRERRGGCLTHSQDRARQTRRRDRASPEDRPPALPAIRP
jgi:hypothetical protein